MTREDETMAIAQQLAAQRLRLASPTEAGWYVMVTASDGSAYRVWATDLPGCDVERVVSCLDYRVPVHRVTTTSFRQISWTLENASEPHR